MAKRWIPREMSPLKQQKLLKKFSVYDFETNAWIDDTYGMKEEDIMEWHGKPIKPFLIMHYDGETVTSFDHIGDFVDFYLKKRFRMPHICFAHNGGKFDVLGIFHYMYDNPKYKKYKITPIPNGSSLMALTIADDSKHKWSFRDSFHLLPRSLNALCQGFKLKQIKTERPDVPYKGNRNKNIWRKYCANDCISLHQILSMFNKIIGDVDGVIGYTLASTALKTFRFSFQKEPYPTYHSYNNLFRGNAYYGGRCEIFRHLMPKYSGSYYLYDFNSLYPSVMKGNKYPIGYPTKVRYGDANDCRGRNGIMECKVYAPDDLDIPLLPYHRPSQDPNKRKLLFPIGEWTAFYDFALIEKALDLGYLIDPIRAWEFKADYIFDDFVDTFYPMKVANKGNAKGEVAKLIQNSLYGKLAERSEREELVGKDDDYAGAILTDYVYGYARRKKTVYSAYQLPAISIHVTALAQLKLYEYIEEILAMGGDVYYCDTDSVVTNLRMPTSDGLGEMKLEYDFEYGIALSPKFYYFHAYDDIKRLKNVACKGFSFPFKKRITYDLLFDALTSGNFCQLNEMVVKPASFKTGAIRKLDGWTTVVAKRSVKSTYDKRHVMEDYLTKPLRMPDDL